MMAKRLPSVAELPRVAKRLCVGDVPVPLVTLSHFDADMEGCDADFVQLMGRAAHLLFLTQPFGLHVRSLSKNWPSATTSMLQSVRTLSGARGIAEPLEASLRHHSKSWR